MSQAEQDILCLLKKLVEILPSGINSKVMESGRRELFSFLAYQLFEQCLVAMSEIEERVKDKTTFEGNE